MGGSPKAPFHIDFYVGPGGRALTAQYHDWLGTNMRNEYLKDVTNVKLAEAIHQLYRSTAFIGDGGTASVFQFEKTTGLLLSPKGHAQKVEDSIRWLKYIANYESLTSKEVSVIQKIINDLTIALGE